MYWISAPTAQRLHLATHTCRLGKDYSITVAKLPRYAPGRALPPPQGSPCGNVVMVQPKGLDDADGQFSGSYFYGTGTWTFNYPDRKLILQGTLWQPEPSAHAAALGFQRNDKGRATFGYARIEIRVGNTALPMLLDTGATAYPTPAGEKASGTPTVNGEGVTSYIVKSIFDRWHKEHPDWKVVEDGDHAFGPHHPTPIIEVPKVEIAGWSVGPVWFTERPDSAFYDMMSSTMDKRPDGAAGANIFRHFVMTIDYPKATAYFRCSNSHFGVEGGGSPADRSFEANTLRAPERSG
ncbi:MAG TPA: hypothetical protein VF292_13790 [Rhodanobacteraceae bacterium]